VPNGFGVVVWVLVPVLVHGCFVLGFQLVVFSGVYSRNLFKPPGLRFTWVVGVASKSGEVHGQVKDGSQIREKGDAPTTEAQNRGAPGGQAVRPPMVLIGPFIVKWYDADSKELIVKYQGGNIVSRAVAYLDPSKIHNAYVVNVDEWVSHYYFVYEATERLEHYLEYATTLPDGARQVNELKVAYGCRADGRFYSSEEDCFDMVEVAFVKYFHEKFVFPNDVDLSTSTVLTEYRPNLADDDVVLKWLEKHGIKAVPYGPFSKPRIRVLRELGEGVEYGVKYKDVVGFKYFWFYDDPCPMPSRIRKYRFYYTSRGKEVGVRDLGDVQLSEITSEDLRSLIEDEVLALAVGYEGEELQELLRKARAKPYPQSIARCKEEWEYERKRAEELRSRNMKVAVEAWGGEWGGKE